MAERRNSYTPGMAWGWVNYGIIFSFWGNWPFNKTLHERKKERKKERKITGDLTDEII